MALPAPSDFTDKDFDSFWLRTQALIRSVFPTWTDFSVTNFGNILAQLQAFSLDVLTFTQDNQAAESRITTATQRRSLIALTKLLGYTPALAAAATADVTFTATGLANNCTIPAGTVIKTATDAIPFQLTAPVLLTPGAPSNTWSVENSVTQTQLYNGTGQPNQTLALPQPGFLSVVSALLGGSWSRVTNFLFSLPGDLVYTLVVDNNDVATMTFGDGVNGAMPSGVMTVTYKTGGGSIGNVTAGSITQIDGTIVDSLGNVVSLTASNALAATGGIDRESAASIKLRAPLSLTNPTSSIARTDFEDNALRIASVARALMLTSNEVPTIPDNSGILYVVPVGGSIPGALSATLRDQVSRQFQSDTQGRPPYPKPLTFNLQVTGDTAITPFYVDFLVSARIYLKKNAVGSDVAAAIRAAMTNFFSPTVTDQAWADKIGVELGARNPGIDFGYNLRQLNSLASPLTQGVIELSDLMDVVHDVPGVRGIGTAPTDFGVVATRISVPTTVASGHVDTFLLDSDFPRISATPMVITDIDTGTSL